MTQFTLEELLALVEDADVPTDIPMSERDYRTTEEWAHEWGISRRKTIELITRLLAIGRAERVSFMGVRVDGQRCRRIGYRIVDDGTQDT